MILSKPSLKYRTYRWVSVHCHHRDACATRGQKAATAQIQAAEMTRSCCAVNCTEPFAKTEEDYGSK